MSSVAGNLVSLSSADAALLTSVQRRDRVHDCPVWNTSRVARFVSADTEIVFDSLVGTLIRRLLMSVEEHLPGSSF